MPGTIVVEPSDGRRNARKLRLDWRGALVFMTREDGWKQKVLLGGLMLLCLPPVGWVMALGYRSMTGKRLTTGINPALPAWRGSMAEAFVRGLKSSGVILAYLAPGILAFLLFGAGSVSTLLGHAEDIALTLLACMVFPPAAIPALPLLAFFRWSWFDLSPTEAILVVVVALGAIVLLPSAFLRVAATGSYSAAFQVRTAVRFVLRNPGTYLEAWVLSLGVSACAVALVPLAPWLLFWSYLVILHAFLQVLWRDSP